MAHGGEESFKHCSYTHAFEQTYTGALAVARAAFCCSDSPVEDVLPSWKCPTCHTPVSLTLQISCMHSPGSTRDYLGTNKHAAVMFRSSSMQELADWSPSLRRLEPKAGASNIFFLCDVCRKLAAIKKTPIMVPMQSK